MTAAILKTDKTLGTRLRQSLSTTILFRTTLTRMNTPDRQGIRLGPNHLQCIYSTKVLSTVSFSYFFFCKYFYPGNLLYQTECTKTTNLQPGTSNIFESLFRVYFYAGEGQMNYCRYQQQRLFLNTSGKKSTVQALSRWLWPSVARFCFFSHVVF